MRKDCADKNGDEDAINYLFDNIEVVCEVKGHPIVIEFPTADCTTTTEPTTTETTTQTTTTEPTTTETTTTEPTTTETTTQTTTTEPTTTETTTQTTTTEPTTTETTTELTTQTTTCIVSDPCGALEIAPFTDASISSFVAH